VRPPCTKRIQVTWNIITGVFANIQTSNNMNRNKEEEEEEH
jgi:hypothetical protein